MKLNAEQQQLFDKITTASFSKLLVVGEAGSGKTFSICKSVSELVRQGVEGVVLCAPTHLARLNIVNKLDSDVRHLVDTSTVASLLMKFGIETDDGTTHFTAGKLDRIDKYKIVILDECSMISEQDYMLFMTSKAKVIFTGDMKQLPPVMAKSAEPKMDRHQETGNLEVFRLVQQMRQKGVIHAAAERNREKAWFPEETTVGDSGESIIVHDTLQAMQQVMIDGLLNDPRGYGATHHYRYITYKNVDVRSVGKYIRDKVLEHYYGFDASGIPFIHSELVMMRENKGAIGFNGELVEIVGVKRDSRHNYYPWDSYELMVKGSLGTGLIRTIPPCQLPRMTEAMDKLQSRLKSMQISGDTESASKILSEIKKIKSYWTLVQNPYAVTTHKSQGSTIENVFLDTRSFVRAPSRRALLYVGISRASKSLHVVKVPAKLQLDSREVNQRYRDARNAYQDTVGESYTKVIRYLGVSTGSIEGKLIVAEYLEAVVADAIQGD